MTKRKHINNKRSHSHSHQSNSHIRSIPINLSNVVPFPMRITRRKRSPHVSFPCKSLLSSNEVDPRLAIFILYMAGEMKIGTR